MSKTKFENCPETSLDNLNISKKRDNYNADLVRKKAEGKWMDIWDLLSIPTHYQQDGACPICKAPNGFKIENKQMGTFRCDICSAHGDGIMLIQLFHNFDFFDALEKVGRVLRLRKRESRNE